MSFSHACTPVTAGPRLGALVLALGLTAPAGVLLATPVSARPPVAVTAAETTCGVTLSLTGLPAGPHEVLVSVTAADGTALALVEQGRRTVDGGAPQTVDVLAAPPSSGVAQPFAVEVTVDQVEQPALEVELPECSATSPATPSPTPSPTASLAASPPASPEASASPFTEAPSPAASPEMAASPSAPASPAEPSPASTSPSPSAAPERGASPLLAAPGVEQQSVMSAAAAPASAPPPAEVGTGISGAVPLSGFSAPLVAGTGSGTAVSALAVAPLPLTAPPAQPVPAAAPPLVALPEGAAGPLLAAPAPQLDELLPELPAHPEAAPTPEVAADVLASTTLPQASASALADALPGVLLLAGLVGARARRCRIA